jgi:hypothetical protein
MEAHGNREPVIPIFGWSSDLIGPAFRPRASTAAPASCANRAASGARREGAGISAGTDVPAHLLHFKDEPESLR